MLQEYMLTNDFFAMCLRISQESVRGGDVKSTQLLLDHGADINARTKGHEAGASGGTPLWWALYYHQEDHEVVQLLKQNGAKNLAPHQRSEL